jgi:hypothetical protein
LVDRYKQSHANVRRRPRELLRKLGRRLRLSGSGTNNSDTAPIALQAPVQAAAALPAAAPLVEAPLVAAPRVAAFPVADPPRSRLEHQIQTLFAQGLDASPELSPNSSTSSFSEAPLPPIPTEAPLPPLPTQTPADNVQITINVYYVQELGAPDPNHWQPRAADMTVERVPRGGNDPPTVSTPAEDNLVSTDLVCTLG